MKAHGGAAIGIILPCTAPDIVSCIAHLGKFIAALHALDVSRVKYPNLDILVSKDAAGTPARKCMAAGYERA
jgi:hypothetical protein